jgi:hypothetical protein
MYYGIYLDGMLVERFTDVEEAYDAARFAWEETGLFHEVKYTHPLAKTIEEI